MKRWLFPAFLEDVQQYDECRRFWVAVVERIAARYGYVGCWRPWQTSHYADGTPMREGNPIFDAGCSSLRRGFHIIQRAPTDAGAFVDAWLKRYGEQFPGFPGNELAIELTLSERSARLAERLLELWMNPATTPEAMEAFIGSVRKTLDEDR